MAKQVSVIEEALNDVVEDVDVDRYVKRFDDLEGIVNNFIKDAEGWPSNNRNIGELTRLKNIRKALNEYKNAYANSM